jgi:hypothetical protein
MTMRSVVPDTVSEKVSEVGEVVANAGEALVNAVVDAVVDAEKMVPPAVVAVVADKAVTYCGWFSPLKDYLYRRVPVLSSTPLPETLVKKVTEVVSVPDVLPVQASAKEPFSEESQQNPGQSDPSK